MLLITINYENIIKINYFIFQIIFLYIYLLILIYFNHEGVMIDFVGFKFLFISVVSKYLQNSCLPLQSILLKYLKLLKAYFLLHGINLCIYKDE